MRWIFHIALVTEVWRCLLTDLNCDRNGSIIVYWKARLAWAVKERSWIYKIA